VPQIISAEGDDVGPPAFEDSEVGAVVLDLKIYQAGPHTRPTGRLATSSRPMGSSLRKILV